MIDGNDVAAFRRGPDPMSIARDFEFVIGGGFHEFVAVRPVRVPFLGSKLRPFGEQPHGGNSGFGHFEEPFRVVAKRTRGRTDAPRCNRRLLLRRVGLCGRGLRRDKRCDHNGEKVCAAG